MVALKSALPVSSFPTFDADEIVRQAYSIGNALYAERKGRGAARSREPFVVKVGGVAFKDPYWLFVKSVEFEAPEGNVHGREKEFAEKAARAMMHRDYELAGLGENYEIVVNDGWWNSWTFAQMRFSPNGNATRIGLDFLEVGYTDDKEIAKYLKEAFRLGFRPV